MYRQRPCLRHERTHCAQAALTTGLIRLARQHGLAGVVASVFAVLLLGLQQTALADDDDCFRLPNGTRFCAKPPPRSTPAPDAGSKKPSREAAPERRAGRTPVNPRRPADSDRAVRAAGGLAFLVEQFDAQQLPALKPAERCLCRDQSEPVYGFCTEGNRTYKPACAN